MGRDRLGGVVSSTPGEPESARNAFAVRRLRVAWFRHRLAEGLLAPGVHRGPTVIVLKMDLFKFLFLIVGKELRIWLSRQALMDSASSTEPCSVSAPAPRSGGFGCADRRRVGARSKAARRRPRWPARRPDVPAEKQSCRAPPRSAARIRWQPKPCLTGEHVRPASHADDHPIRVSR